MENEFENLVPSLTLEPELEKLSAALDLEGAALVEVDRSTRVIALEVHALACQGFELGHVDRIRILRTCCYIGNLAGNLDSRRISTAYRNSTRGSYPSGSINIRICRRVAFIAIIFNQDILDFIRNQISLFSTSSIGNRMST